MQAHTNTNTYTHTKHTRIQTYAPRHADLHIHTHTNMVAPTNIKKNTPTKAHKKLSQNTHTQTRHTNTHTGRKYTGKKTNKKHTHIDPSTKTLKANMQQLHRYTSRQAY